MHGATSVDAPVLLGELPKFTAGVVDISMLSSEWRAFRPLWCVYVESARAAAEAAGIRDLAESGDFGHVPEWRLVEQAKEPK
jgi:hypothetical protein